MTSTPDEIRLARADFERRASIEAMLCAEAERKAERALQLVKGLRVTRGADHSYKTAGLSNLVHYRDPIE